MQEIIDFLRDLRVNNNRPWFQQHKEQYIHCQQLFNAFTQRLIEGVESFDSTVRNLSPADCTYRIYRDVRFSADKSPYKCHMGCYICPGGRKSGYAGYYFHIGAGAQDEGYPFGHMIAVGDYCYAPKALQVIREDITTDNGEFDHIVRHQCSPLFSLDNADALKRNPKGFPLDAPYPEYLRLKTFCLCYSPSDSLITSPTAASQVVELFRTTLPFTQYINRAINYSRAAL